MSKKENRRQRPRVGLRFDEARDRTKQSMKEECDINGIMARFERTGQISHVAKIAPRYGDFSEAPENLQHALLMVQEARNMFMGLPAKTRARFGNDPIHFVDFCSDPANAEELVELGLAEKKAAPGGAEGEPKVAPSSDASPKSPPKKSDEKPAP